MAFKSAIGSFDLEDPTMYEPYAVELDRVRSKLGLVTVGAWYNASGEQEDRTRLAEAREDHDDLIHGQPQDAERLFGYLALHGTPLVRDVIAYKALKVLDVQNPNRRLKPHPDPGLLTRIVVDVLRDERCLDRDTHFMFKLLANYVEGDFHDRAPTFEYALFAAAYNVTHPDLPVRALRPPLETE